MPRLRQVPRSEAADEIVVGAYNHLFGDRDPVAQPGTSTGSPGNWWTTFALAPDLLRHALRGFRLAGSTTRSIDSRLRELAMTRAAWVIGSTFVYSQHCKVLRALQFSEHKIAAIPYWSIAEGFDSAERVVLAYADCIAGLSGRVPDPLFDALRTHFEDKQVLELTFFIGLYVSHASTVRALRLEFDDRPDEVVEVAAPEGSDAASVLRDLQGG